MDSSAGPTHGRPFGGLAILWRKSLGTICSVKDYGDDRLLSIELKLNCKTITLLNVYLPCDDGTNMDVFQSYLTKVDSIISETPYSCAIGDFNANTARVNHRFGNELTNFCNEENLIMSDMVLGKSDCFTFVSSAHNTVAWLDHIISTHSLHALISSVSVNHSYISSDHFPLFAKLDLGKINLLAETMAENIRDIQRISWSDVSPSDIKVYQTESRRTLSDVPLNHSLLLCDNPACTDPAHKAAITKMYNDIVAALISATSHLQKPTTEHKYKQIAGWNDLCAELHDQARDAFLLWKLNSKPRSGPLCDLMRSTRARFKSAIRQCKKDKSKKSSDSLAQKLLLSNKKNFWKEIQRINNEDQNTPLAETVNGKTGLTAINQMWKNHFSSLLNSSSCTDKKNSVQECLSHNLSYERFNHKDIAKAIRSIKLGKSPGLDNLYGEHLKYSDDKVLALLSLVFNSMIIHAYLPSIFMDTIIIPLVKDKKGDLQSSDNYRPIAITSIMSKVFEILILDRYANNFHTTCHQFGFKANHATDQCVFVLKQILDYYKCNSSAIYVCFLDLSKAFDRVNHWLLFDKLLSRKLPSIIVRILSVWYETQHFIIQWGKSLSEPFVVSNGVRQGGVLSPVLFNVFIDDLSVELKGLSIGCRINSLSFNHLVYADDTVLLAPSPNALQILIDKCEQYAKNHDLLFNVKKTKCMCVKSLVMKDIHVPKFFLNGSQITQVKRECYLGVEITDDCMDDATIIKERKKLYARGNTILRKFRHCTKEVKISLFLAYCTSFYCGSLWSNFKRSSFKSIQVAHNTMFKMLMGADRRSSASGSFATHNVPNLLVIQRKMVFSLYSRVLSSQNMLVFIIVNSINFNSSNIYTKWRTILFK